MYDTPQSKGMIDGDTIIVELLITGDANRLAHLAVEKLKDNSSIQPINTNPCRMQLLKLYIFKSTSSINLHYIVMSCVGRRDFWLKLKQMNGLTLRLSPSMRLSPSTRLRLSPVTRLNSLDGSQFSQ